ncbi:MAG: glycosyltransferase [Terriglobia bacterium]
MEISIVIPTYNRAASLAETLQQLAGLEGVESLACEVIVVDNNSTGDTRQVTESFASVSRVKVRYVFERAQGASYARNRGIRESAGEILTFIDDDMVIPSPWLLQMKKAFEDFQAACVGGPVLADPRQKLPSWWDERMLAPLSVFDLGAETLISNESDRSKHMLATGGNCGFRRSALERNGGFRTDIGRFGNRLGGGEDSELVLRLQHKGETVVYYPQALLYHAPDTRRFTKESMSRFFYNYGITCCQMDMLFPESGPRLAGIARWKYRWLLQNSLKACWRMITGNSRDAFYHRMCLYKNWGYTGAILKTRRSMLLRAGPQPVPQRSS